MTVIMQNISCWNTIKGHLPNLFFPKFPAFQFHMLWVFVFLATLASYLAPPLCYIFNYDQFYDQMT